MIKITYTSKNHCRKTVLNKKNCTVILKTYTVIGNNYTGIKLDDNPYLKLHFKCIPL